LGLRNEELLDRFGGIASQDALQTAFIGASLAQNNELVRLILGRAEDLLGPSWTAAAGRVLFNLAAYSPPNSSSSIQFILATFGRSMPSGFALRALERAVLVGNFEVAELLFSFLQELELLQKDPTKNLIPAEHLSRMLIHAGFWGFRDNLDFFSQLLTLAEKRNVNLDTVQERLRIVSTQTPLGIGSPSDERNRQQAVIESAARAVEYIGDQRSVNTQLAQQQTSPTGTTGTLETPPLVVGQRGGIGTILGGIGGTGSVS